MSRKTVKTSPTIPTQPPRHFLVSPNPKQETVHLICWCGTQMLLDDNNADMIDDMNTFLDRHEECYPYIVAPKEQANG